MKKLILLMSFATVLLIGCKETVRTEEVTICSYNKTGSITEVIVAPLDNPAQVYSQEFAGTLPAWQGMKARITYLESSGSYNQIITVKRIM